MAQTLTIELSDDAIDSIRRQATALGSSPAELAATALEQRFGDRAVEGGGIRVDQREARARFERHFGEIDLDGSSLADNESIDADLAGEYARTLEDD